MAWRCDEGNVVELFAPCDTCRIFFGTFGNGAGPGAALLFLTEY